MDKVTKLKSIPRKELSAYNVAVMFLKGADVPLNSFTKNEIEYIGLRAMHKCKVVIGTLNDKWVIIKRGAKGVNPMYAFVGKKMIEFMNKPKKVVSHKLTSVEILSRVSAQEIFSSATYRPTRKCKSKVKMNDKIKYEQKRVEF